MPFYGGPQEEILRLRSGWRKRKTFFANNEVTPTPESSKTLAKPHFGALALLPSLSKKFCFFSYAPCIPFKVGLKRYLSSELHRLHFLARRNERWNPILKGIALLNFLIPHSTPSRIFVKQNYRVLIFFYKNFNCV